MTPVEPLAETLIARLTPTGKGAIATLAIQGLRAWDTTRALFRPRSAHESLPAEPEIGRHWFGTLGDAVRDEVVLAVQEKSGTIVVELHCHGGPEVVRALEEVYVALGVVAVSWQTLVARTQPCTQADALGLLAQAPTVRTAAILLDQYHGAFERACEFLRRAFNAEDFSAQAQLQRLQAFIPLGRHLVEPWQVVIAGAPNVGKSSLVNALAGYTRSVVSAQPGTTRDVVSTALALDGWPVLLSDTAGLRAGASPLESAGIARARQSLAEADLCVWVLDGSAQPILPDDPARPWLVVINKSDCPAAWSPSQIPTALRVSAHTLAGIAELCQELAGRLVPSKPNPGEAVPCTLAQAAAVERACQEVKAGRYGAAAHALTVDALG